MKRIPDVIWWVLWAMPFGLLGIFCAQFHFIFWSAQYEFKRGYYWTLKQRIKTNEATGGES